MDLPLPNKLYKYRAFNVFCLRLLTHGDISYSDPRLFNDPLDCDPTIEMDLNRAGLENLCYTFLRRELGDQAAKDRITEFRSEARDYTDPQESPSPEDYLNWRLATEVRASLKRDMGNKGVLSLAEQWDSVLMWSHYADNHRGICIEFDLAGGSYPNLRPIDYRAPRSIKASDLLNWKIHASAEAERLVRDTYYLAKASAWQYEKEWRDIASTSGVHRSDLRITGIYFGLQCDPSVIQAVVKLLDSDQDVALYRVYPREDSFQLQSTLIEREEIASYGLHQPAWYLFKDVALPTD